MQTFDSALFNLVVAGRISEEEAIKNADSANNLRLRLKLREEDSSSQNGALKLSLEEDKTEKKEEEEEPPHKGQTVF
jgi:twitching motility protein PilU